MKRVILLLTCVLLISMTGVAQTVSDYDGNVYHMVTIGSQVWLQENMKVTHFRNGDAISNVTDHTSWNGLSTPAYCTYNNIPDSADVYGHLYNSYAMVDSRGLCPLGWHVPTRDEVLALSLSSGGSSSAGGNMKETGLIHWESPNTGATNSTGFTALPGGLRGSGFYQQIGHDGYFGTVSPASSGFYQFSMSNESAFLYINANSGNETDGVSVRCKQGNASVENNDGDKKVIIFPNPAQDQIIVTTPEVGQIKLCIINSIGEIVMQRDLIGVTNSIDIQSLSPGIFIVRLSCDTWTLEQQLVKE